MLRGLLGVLGLINRDNEKGETDTPMQNVRKEIVREVTAEKGGNRDRLEFHILKGDDDADDE